MTVSAITTTINADEVIQNLVFSDEIIKDAHDGLYAAGTHVMSVLSEYPPISDANVAGPYPKRWYVRGIGSHWALKKGGFHFSRNSQQLNKRWAIEQQDEGATVKIGNNASYAPFVHDLEHQPFFHAIRGWKVAQFVIEQERENVINKIRDFILAGIKTRKG